MNENLIYIAENIDVEKDWPDGRVYASVMSCPRQWKTIGFLHPELSNIDLTKPLDWFTKEEVIKAQQQLTQKEWASFEESGVPPVGTMLMNWAKEKREVVLVCDDHVVCRTFEGKTGYKAYYFNHWESYSLKPWKEKTDEEIAVEKMIEVAHTQVCHDPCIRNLMLGIYREIKSGKIKI